MTGKTTIVPYVTYMNGWYDLENNPYQRQQMLNHAIPNNLKIFGGELDTYIEALRMQVTELELKINPMVLKHFVLTKQIEFLEKVKKGEINGTQKGNTNTPGRPTTTEGVDDEGTISSH